MPNLQRDGHYAFVIRIMDSENVLRVFVVPEILRTIRNLNSSFYRDD